jgi:hypothetical protein
MAERRRRPVPQPVRAAATAVPVDEPRPPADEPRLPADVPVPGEKPPEPVQPAADEAQERPPPAALTRVHARLARRFGRRSRFL